MLRGYLLPGLLSAMQKSGISRKELADKSGVNYTTLWRLESCKYGASPATLSQIAEALGVPESVLRSASSPVAA